MVPLCYVSTEEKEKKADPVPNLTDFHLKSTFVKVAKQTCWVTGQMDSGLNT